MTGRFAPRAAAAPRPAAELEATIGAVLAGARVYIDVQVPGTDAAGRMRVLTRSESLSVKVEALALFQERGLVHGDGLIAAVAADDWRCEIAVRHLAIAVREADDGPPLAPLADWRELTDEQIGGPWDRYQDLRDRLDPLSAEASPLTADELAVMRALAKKKDAAALRSFGLHRLALFAATSADPPAS